MQAAHHFHLELRQATMPTYVASYLFPVVLLVYEAHRVGMMDFRLRDELRERAHVFEPSADLLTVQVYTGFPNRHDIKRNSS